MEQKMYNLGIIGLSPGNGHPYSWSAIFNGYNKDKMARCPFSAIPDYLNEQDPSTMCIEDAKVTHIWTQDIEISKDVAGASLIDQICNNATDMIGEVDGILLARDDGERHLEMARPFIEANIPIFMDKPLTDQAKHLPEFIHYYETGKPIMSCSSMRYSSVFEDVTGENSDEQILAATATTPKHWSTYGIHLIEGIYKVMGKGVQSVKGLNSAGASVVHLFYKDGKEVVLHVFENLKTGLCFTFFSKTKIKTVVPNDSFFMFKKSMEDYVEMLKTGKSPIDWKETVEMSKIVIAGQRSLKQNGATINLDSI